MNTDTVHMRDAAKLVRRGPIAIKAAIATGEIRAELIMGTLSPFWRIDRTTLLAWRDLEPSRVFTPAPARPERDPDALTYKGAAALLGCAPDTIRDALLHGDITGTPANFARRIPGAVERASVLAWWAARQGKRRTPNRPRPQGTRPPMDAVTGAVCARCMVPPERVHIRDRSTNVAMARQMAMYALYHSGYSCAEIARHLDRDHATIVHGLACVEARASWQETALQCAHAAYDAPTAADTLARTLAIAVEDYPPADARAVTAYVRGTLLCHTTAPGPLCAHGLWLLATQPRLYRVVVDRLTRSGYGADAGRIEGQMARLGYRRSA